VPLMKSKSKRAFKHNISAEIKAGKPQKQAVAIAFSEQRRANKAYGGSVSYPTPKDQHYNKGGYVNEKLHPEYEPVKDSMVEELMRRRRKMSKGGEAGMNDMGPLAEGYEDSDMHDEDFLSQDGDQEEFPGDHSSNEFGNEDQEEARRQMRKARMARVMGQNKPQ
jgi:hypothetical protein